MTSFRYYRWLVLSALAAAWLSCASPTPEPVGFDPYDRPIHTLILKPSTVGWRDTYYDKFSPTGRHYRLACGAWGGYRSRTLLRYDVGDIPKEIRVSKITAISLQISYVRVSGSVNDQIYAYTPVKLTLHPLLRSFDEDRATWWLAKASRAWTEEGGDFGPAVGSVELGSPSYQREFYYVDITPTALDWMANPARNYGLVLKADGEESAAGIKEFYATNAGRGGFAPLLDITYVDDDGEKQTRYVAPQKDCFITDYDEKFDGNAVHGYDEYLDFGCFNGYGRRTLVYVDLNPAVSGVPANASVVRARLRMYYLPAGRDERVYVAVYRLTAPFAEGATEDTLEQQKYHDNVAYVALEFKKTPPGYVDFYINPLVQEWVAGEHPNYGLMIKAPDESEAQVFPRFAAQHNADEGRRPYLEVDYTLPAEPWYAARTP